MSDTIDHKAKKRKVAIGSDDEDYEEDKPTKSTGVATKVTQEKAKPAPSKKKDDDYDDESEEESDEDEFDDESSESDEYSDFEEKKKKPAAKKKTPTKKKETPKKSKPAKDSKSKSQSSSQPLKTKNSLVYDVLKRWWYVMPDWPPKDYDYGPALLRKGLRKVETKYWKVEPEEKDGKRKVFEISSYPGLFKNSQGEIIDLRPSDSCPSFENLKKKSQGELAQMLVTALKTQIFQLDNSENPDPELSKELQKELAKAQKLADSYKGR
eukprot:CAMPEP_0176439036 /NCGR_PEP_ID=MMETSP0127-20121128/19682_1 /TAXON_ID=938130 /ORGANISM="Platyophrya macrostoma, Strain WH" /LENGTH=266 /DNA_ID=CAMNT_0017823185 /DNA_START=15 /DNA_END=815 /DNA_ORIENTATION=+